MAQDTAQLHSDVQGTETEQVEGGVTQRHIYAQHQRQGCADGPKTRQDEQSPGRVGCLQGYFLTPSLGTGEPRLEDNSSHGVVR